MENTTRTSNLKSIYNTVDWIDFGLVFAVIFYYGRLMNNLEFEFPYSMEFDYMYFFNLAIENATNLGIVLLLASLAVCTTFIVLTVMMRRRREIGIFRTAGRIIWNVIWIPLDVYALILILAFRMN